jgi:hypothetical protein
MTTTRKKVTKAQSEAVLKAVAVWLGKKGLGELSCPKKRALTPWGDHEDDGSPCLFAVAGPAPTGKDAAYRGLGPELMLDFDGHPAIVLEGGPYDWAINCSLAIQKAMDAKGITVFVEPYAGYALSIYRED